MVKSCGGRFGRTSRTVPARAGSREKQFQTRDFSVARSCLNRIWLATRGEAADGLRKLKS